MDSLSQIILGASVGKLSFDVVDLFYKRSKSLGDKSKGKSNVLTSNIDGLFWGAIAGTLPDLDYIFLDRSDDVSVLTDHRGWSHSFFYQILASPFFAGLVALLKKKKCINFFIKCLVLFIFAFVTHSLLDTMTIYGTKLFFPFTSYPYAVGSVFIIDPLYTVPFIFFLVISILYRKNIIKCRFYNNLGLFLSSCYLLLSVFLQMNASSVFRDMLKDNNVKYSSMIVQASAFNTVLWRCVAISDDSYYETFFTYLNPSKKFPIKEFDRNLKYEDLLDLESNNDYKKLIYFSKNFYSLVLKGNSVLYQDLRFGFNDSYYFSYKLGEIGLKSNKIGLISSHDTYITLKKFHLINNQRLSSGESFRILIDNFLGK